MTRADIIADFEAIIDEVGTSEFTDNIDQFINTAIKAIFRKLMDPQNPNHPDAKGFERDLYLGEYIAQCKHLISGTAAAAGTITVAEIEALMPVGRTLSRISSLKVKFDSGSEAVVTEVKTSPEAAVQSGLRFYKPDGTCRVFLERIFDGYRVYPSDDPAIFEGIAISFPRELSPTQTEVDLDDFLRPTIAYYTAILAGVAIRDSEYTREAATLITQLGL